ncbi:DMT family transporter [Chloroflexota bacterium]
MHWLYLMTAIVLEVCGTTCMKLSDGFSKLTPSILIFVFYGVSFSVFVFALKRIDVGIAYAIWAGLGVMLMAAVGVFYFKEAVNVLKLVSMALVIAGVVGLYLSGTGE